MRPRSIIAAAGVIVIAAATLYYFYGYRHQAVSANITALMESTSDAATTAAVKTALALNKQVSAFDIHVESGNNAATSNNNVTLTGQVPTDDDKRVAEEIARGTKGVANVVNNLQVDPKIQAANAARQHVTDLEIKVALLESVLSNPDLKTQQIKVEVNNGEVKLSGSVQIPAQKAAAESAARTIANVRNVDSNALAVTNVTSS